MMKRKKIDHKIYRFNGWHLLLFILFVGLALFLACAGPESGYGPDEEEGGGSGGTNANLEISDVNYAVINMAPGNPIIDMFYKSPAGVNSCFWFTVKYIDPEYQESEVEEDEVEDEDVSPEEDYSDFTITFSFGDRYQWIVLGSDNNIRIDRELGLITVFNLHPWEDSSGSDGSGSYVNPENVLPLGYLTVDIEWGEDKKAHFEQNIVGPRELETAVSNSAYTEDVLQMPSGAGVYAMLQRADDQGSILALDGTARIQFSVPDRRVENGEIWFFDDESNPIGSTNDFNSLEQEGKPIVNNGTGFSNTGRNLVQINLSDVSPVEFAVEDFDPAAITQYAIVLTDNVVFDPYLNILSSGYISITGISEFGTQVPPAW